MTRGTLYKVSRRLLLAFVIVIVVLIALHFPRQVDEPLPPGKEDPRFSKQYKQFYEAAWAPKGTSFEGVVKSYPPSEHPSYERLGEFREVVQKYGLSDKRVLDVGSGDGSLQDLVTDYTGLDISESARRFYHKPFVAASATSMPLVITNSTRCGALAHWSMCLTLNR